MSSPSSSADRKLIQCNYAVGTNIAARGARAYVINVNRGNGYDRLYIKVRSRGGRWVVKWENAQRLTNFRVKTVPVEHEMHADDLLADACWEHDFLAAVGAPGPYPEPPPADIPDVSAGPIAGGAR